MIKVKKNKKNVAKIIKKLLIIQHDTNQELLLIEELIFLILILFWNVHVQIIRIILSNTLIQFKITLK